MKSKKEITIDSYNRTADQYFKVVSEFDPLPELFEFAKLIERGGKILDLGCGPGHHAGFFSEEGFEVIGVDLSEKMIEIAQKNTSKAHFEVMDISNLNFSHDSFDGIWASASLLHIPKDEIQIVLQRLHEILKKDGTLYISLKLGESEDFFVDPRYGGVLKFYIYYTAAEIEKLLRNTNFVVLDHWLKQMRANYDTNSWIHIFARKS